MNPNDYQYPVDYLNQIAPEPQKKGLEAKKLFLLGGLAIVVALIIFFVLGALSGGNTSRGLPNIPLRLETLQKISDDSQKNIKSSELRSINGSLSVLLTGSSTSIAAPLAKSGVDVKKIDSKLKENEKTYSEQLAAKLDDARLNAVFDRTYAREMSFELAKLNADIKRAIATTRNTDLKNALTKVSGDSGDIKKQLDKFSATTS